MFSSCWVGFKAAGSHILTSESEYLRLRIYTRALGSTKQTARGGRRRAVSTWMHRQNSQRQTCPRRHTHTHAHTVLCCFIRSGSFWQERANSESGSAKDAGHSSLIVVEAPRAAKSFTLEAQHRCRGFQDNNTMCPKCSYM